jgi:hypothetical protein
MGEMGISYRILIGMPESKRPLEELRHSWEDIIKMDHWKIGFEVVE